MEQQKPPLYKGFFAQFPLGISRVAEVMRYGANKHSWFGWLTVEDADTVYRDALLRHMTAIAEGEVTDRDSGQPHVAHVASNAMILLELHEVARQGD